VKIKFGGPRFSGFLTATFTGLAVNAGVNGEWGWCVFFAVSAFGEAYVWVTGEGT
jgi:hypothetical protein